MKWVGTRLALFKPGTCRCRCSSSNSFHEPSAREVTSNSFGMAHLHRASLRMSLQDWCSVGERLAVRANRVRGELALRQNVDATGAVALLMCPCMSGCHKTHALCRVLLLIHMLKVFIMQLSSLMGWTSRPGLLSEWYLNKHRPYFHTLLRKSYQFLSHRLIWHRKHRILLINFQHSGKKRLAIKTSMTMRCPHNPRTFSQPPYEVHSLTEKIFYLHCRGYVHLSVSKITQKVSNKFKRHFQAMILGRTKVIGQNQFQGGLIINQHIQYYLCKPQYILY